MIKLLYIAFGGIIGSVLRYVIAGIPHKFYWGTFPIGTLFVNLLGSFLIGFGFVLLGKENIPENLKLFLFIGILGSFTTFSTFMFESLNLFKDGDLKFALINLAGANILGLFFVYLGYVIAQYIVNQIH
ncbi:MAG: fluoride efflux transporter CrcB [Bacteroidales bacterium]|jgi:CrcB protein|nr:fluoride efflux transporter CrcB [Bacteroidales bacterium]